MKREQANEILDARRRGRYVPQHRIIEALQTTGDLIEAVKPRRRALAPIGRPLRELRA